MSTLETETRAQGQYEPGPRIRQAVALMLRLAIGLSLLNAGLARLLGMRVTNQVPGMVLFDAPRTFLMMLAYAQVGLGIALIMGFLVTAAAVGACLVLIAIPAYQMLMELGTGGSGAAANDPYVVATNQMLPILMVPNVLLLWLSPVANHPFSVDALVFARAREARAIRPPVTIIGEGSESP